MSETYYVVDEEFRTVVAVMEVSDGVIRFNQGLGYDPFGSSVWKPEEKE